MNTSPGRRAHAVVVGGSIGGILMARVLSEFHDRVTVIERDRFPEYPSTRRGTPQSRQVHALLARGRVVLEDLFPGLTDELVAAGAPLADMQSDMHWYQDGMLMKPAPSGLRGLGVSRPLLEHAIRSRVRDISGVTFMDRCVVQGLTGSRDGSRVTGVRLRADGAAADSGLVADLVVDMSGRGSRSPAWLEDLGYGRPYEETVRVRTTYVARVYQRESHHLGGRCLTACSAFPGTPRSAIAIAQEGGLLTLSLGGWLGVTPPTDDAGALAHAESLATPDFAEIIRTGKPVTEPALMRFPAGIRKRYEDLPSLPGGYLVAGDALCSFNPFYGQGMTVAALQAVLLRDLLDDDHNDPGPAFLRAAARVLDTPWNIAVAGDLRYPEVDGVRTAQMRQFADYLTRFRRAAQDDAHLGALLLRVTNMMDDPAVLAAPDAAERVEAALAGRRSVL
ncbi:FAD-dependent oxidoreductase [Streptomyces sp. NPDC054765]